MMCLLPETARIEPRSHCTLSRLGLESEELECVTTDCTDPHVPQKIVWTSALFRDISQVQLRNEKVQS